MYEGKFEVVQVKTAANLSLLLKMMAGQHTGSKHLTSLSAAGMLWFSTGTTSTVLQLCLKTRRFAAEGSHTVDGSSSDRKYPVTGISYQSNKASNVTNSYVSCPAVLKRLPNLSPKNCSMTDDPPILAPSTSRKGITPQGVSVRTVKKKQKL